jgi:hypothetical protein
MQRNTLPLLRQLAARPDSPVRPAIALVVRALGEGPGVRLPEEEREFWSETLLQWLVQLPGSGAAAARAAGGAGAGAGASQRPKQAKQQQQLAAAAELQEQLELMQRVTEALGALSTPGGSTGLHVAHAWLAELIVHLSRQVRAPPPVEAAAAAAAAAPSSSSSWRWVPWWGSSSSSSSSGDAAGAAAAGVAAEAAALAAGAPEGEAEGAAVVAAAESGGPYLLGASEQPDLGGGGGTADAAEAAAGSTWWQWAAARAWWPWGGGGGGGADDGAGAEGKPAIKASGKKSDSELALYINAAAIGPKYARSVAAELLEASGKVGEQDWRCFLWPFFHFHLAPCCLLAAWLCCCWCAAVSLPALHPQLPA